METDGTYGGIISSLNPSILRNHKADIFIETGTGWANGVLVALAVGFYKDIYSTEIYSLYHEFAANFFKGNERVHLSKGDSRVELSKILDKVNERAFIWLDAHTFDQKNPLYEELDIIAKHPIKNHVIAIDDVRMWRREYNCWKDVNATEITERVLTINHSYKIYFCDSINAYRDIFVADTQ